MGQLGIDVYGERQLADITAALEAAIDAAALGAGLWDEVPAVFSKAFPGSFSALHNIDFTDTRLNFLSSYNLDPQFVTTFQKHFVHINPWNAYWQSAKSGVVAVSEEVAPARLFAHTEFYNDWLLPQNGVEAAIGVKLQGDQGESIQFLMHYPLSQSNAYDRPAAEVLKRTRGSFLRSMELARLLRGAAEKATASSALVERGRCAAFVVDGDRFVREANQQAMDLFSTAKAVSVRSGRSHLADKDADDRFEKALAAMSRRIPVDGSRISFRTVDGAWQVVLAPLPDSGPSPRSILSLLPPRSMVLVLVTDLSLAAQRAGDFSTLATTFRLTPSEVSFCRRLFVGESVADAAEQLGITVETARTRLKAILQKTETTRQGQLMLLLSRLS